jgi:hypothetical protein
MIIGNGMGAADVGAIRATTLLRILFAAAPIAAATGVGLAVLPWTWLLGAGALAAVGVYASLSR